MEIARIAFLTTDPSILFQLEDCYAIVLCPSCFFIVPRYVRSNPCDRHAKLAFISHCVENFVTWLSNEYFMARHDSILPFLINKFFSQFWGELNVIVQQTDRTIIRSGNYFNFCILKGEVPSSSSFNRRF